MSRPKVAVLGVGGTITARERGNGAVPTLSTEDLVAAVPAVADLAELECRTLCSVFSASLSFADVIGVADEIRRYAASGAVDAVVLTHGTDTMEETAFALDLLLSPEFPVVLTGAMRHPDLTSSDGSANLLGAVQVAASGRTAGAGVVVVMDESVHAARFVRKAHTTSLAAFESAPLGPIGWLHEGAVRVAARPVAHKMIEVQPGARVPRVPIYTAALGDDPATLAALVASSPDGLVVAGTGGGHASAAIAPALGDLASRIPVVIASRTGRGEVLRQTYGTLGGDRDLAERGLLAAGILDGLKARIALSLLLMSAHAPHARDAFDYLVRSL